jgi:outer membrane biosynthesis protein TonB
MNVRMRLAATVLAATMLAACGSNGVDLAPRAQRQLQAGLDDVRTAVAAADRLGARSALRELERAVDRLSSEGLISETRAAEIISAAEDVATQLSLLPAAEPSPSPSPSPSPEPTKTEKPPKPPKPKPKPHDEDHDEGKHEGH